MQADVARELGISTTPVREALRDLATEGLIDFHAHRVAVVKKLTYAELVEIHELTKLLEPEAMKLAAENGAHPSVDEAERLAEQMEAEKDVGQWVDLNRQFHEKLVGSVQRKRLLSILKGLRDATAPYTGLALQQYDYRRDTANEQHRELIQTIRDGDQERAAALSNEHVDLTTRVLEGSRELFEPTSGYDPLLQTVTVLRLT